jgi:hypothetical protein
MSRPTDLRKLEQQQALDSEIDFAANVAKFCCRHGEQKAARRALAVMAEGIASRSIDHVERLERAKGLRQ